MSFKLFTLSAVMDALATSIVAFFSRKCHSFGSLDLDHMDRINHH